MALYLSYNIDTNNEKINNAVWSNTDIPVLAIVTEKARITFFQDEALNISEHDMIKDNLISSIAWHPTEMIMAYGYVDGRMGVWIDEENFSKEETGAHEGKITIIKFNLNGNLVISVDERSNIVVWRFEGMLYKQ